ncbi:MAG TPA: bifunctional hydroxymethylpyrimidine kinase/phosphomethylpyrimidine kinase [Opitutales bacterium]|nr:bifunctional hydroxymethylpyrimidine kinase/phosphomethylpyrimidine kinase [Opitutales bacterium]
MTAPAPAALPAALTIAGSDSGGAAGIQADLLTFAACGVYGTSAVTAVTAQSHIGVAAAHPVPPAVVRAQIEQVLAYYPVRAIKIGMLLNAGIIEAVADTLATLPKIPVVADPVMISSSGAMLLEPASLPALTQKLLPNVALVTPNFDEAAVFLGYRPESTPIAMEHAAIALARQFSVPVLLKGGHFALDPALDVLAGPEGVRARLSAPRVPGVDTHGGGCMLAAAITAHLARGAGLVDAVERGRAFLQRCLAAPAMLKDRKILRPAP